MALAPSELLSQLDCNTKSLEQARTNLQHEETLCRQLCDEMKRYQEAVLGVRSIGGTRRKRIFTDAAKAHGEQAAVMHSLTKQGASAAIPTPLYAAVDELQVSLAHTRICRSL